MVICCSTPSPRSTLMYAFARATALVAPSLFQPHGTPHLYSITPLIALRLQHAQHQRCVRQRDYTSIEPNAVTALSTALPKITCRRACLSRDEGDGEAVPGTRSLRTTAPEHARETSCILSSIKASGNEQEALLHDDGTTNCRVQSLRREEHAMLPGRERLHSLRSMKRGEAHGKISSSRSVYTQSYMSCLSLSCACLYPLSASASACSYCSSSRSCSSCSRTMSWPASSYSYPANT